MVIYADEALAAWLADRTTSNRNDLVCIFHYLCRRAARRFSGATQCASDLEQVATIGLIKAIHAFDRTYRTPFAAYAWLMVCGEVRHYVRDCASPVRVPRRLQTLARKRCALEEELTKRLQRTPASNEIAACLGVDRATEAEVRLARKIPVVAADPERSAGRRAAAPAFGLEDGIVLRMALDELPLRERFVLYKIVAGHSQREIAAAIGCSQRHVSRLYQQAIGKMARFWGSGSGFSQRLGVRKQGGDDYRRSDSAGHPAIPGF